MVATSPHLHHFARNLFRRTTGTLVAGMLVVASRPAAADNRVSVDASAAFPSNEADGDGWGVGLRYGHRWGFAILNLTPELGLAYHRFGAPYEPETFGFFGGGRVGIGFIVEPSVFAHAGITYLDRVTSHTSLGYDVGAALDLNIFPIAFGPHLMVAGVAGDSDTDPYSWVSLGGHLTFSLGDEDD